MRRALLLAVCIAGLTAQPAAAATLRSYAKGVFAIADGGHRVALAERSFGAERKTRVIDERTGATLLTSTRPNLYCDPNALGHGLLGYGCTNEQPPVVVSITAGTATPVPVPDTWALQGASVRAIGRRWIWVHRLAYHYDGDQLINRDTGETRLFRDSAMYDPYAVRLAPRRVIDLDSAAGTRALCRPIRRRDYRQPELFFDARATNATWASYPSGEWIQRCGKRPVRLSRRYGVRWVTTARTVAWYEPGRVIVVDRRTLHRRTWHLRADVGNLGLALSHDRIWVNTGNRVLTGRLPGR